MLRLAVTALIAASLGIAAGDAYAQRSLPWGFAQYDFGRVQGRLTLEAFLNQYRAGGLRGADQRLNGFGGRVLWALAPATDPERIDLAARTAIGGFVVHAPDATRRTDTWHYGAEVDFRPLPRAIAGRIEPLLSLGAGAFRTREPRTLEMVLPAASLSEPADDDLLPLRWRTVEVPVERRTTTDFALTPGIGARIGVGPGFALRGDLRDAVVFRDGTRHHVELAAGVSVVF